MKLTYCLSIIFCFFFILSCTTTCFVSIKNKTSKEIYLKFVYNKNHPYYPLSNSITILSNGEKIKPYRCPAVFKWNDSSIDFYSSQIDSLVIFSKVDTILVLEEKEEIINYFKNNRKGLLKGKIELIVEENDSRKNN